MENVKNLIPVIKDTRHTIKMMIPCLKDTALRDVFSKRNLSNEDINLKMLLLEFPSFVHDFLLGQVNTQERTLLQKDLLCLCEKFPNYWIHKKWKDGMDVLSNYSYKSGYYENESFFIGNPILTDRLNIIKDLSEIDNDRIIYDSSSGHLIWKGLFVEFKYGKYTFLWMSNNQVDMYDENGLNIKKNLDFTEKESFKTFFDRLITQAEEDKQTL